MALTWEQEQKVRDAVRFNDGEMLAEVVKSDRFLDYDDLAAAVEDLPNGYRHVSWRGITIGDTKVIERFGRPQVEE